jgi:ABC-type ATPase involved in cell division
LVDLFGSFFDLMKEEPTANVISDQQWSIIAALQELKSRGL